MVRDFFLSWCSARPFEELLAGVRHDAVEATSHIIEECGLLGDCLRTGYDSYPDGVMACPLPDGFLLGTSVPSRNSYKLLYTMRKPWVDALRCWPLLVHTCTRETV